jgi:hypothetical protein
MPPLELASAAGGTVVLPKMIVPGVGFLAYIKDTEGNIVGLMQAEPGPRPPPTPTEVGIAWPVPGEWNPRPVRAVKLVTVGAARTGHPSVTGHSRRQSAARLRRRIRARSH